METKIIIHPSKMQVPFCERVVAAIVIFLFSPVLIMLMLWVKIVSPGPALYISERIGKEGQLFRLFKLRTMIPNAYQIVSDDFRTLQVEGDPRVIRGGKFLRKGFDELFQLINIVRGEMRFIGPRPDLSWMKGKYLPSVISRISVPPGVTGWAQVVGGRDISTRQGYLLDLWYVANRTWLLDLGIVLWTPLYILLGVKYSAKTRNRCLEEMSGIGPLLVEEKKEGDVV